MIIDGRQDTAKVERINTWRQQVKNAVKPWTQGRYCK